MRLKKQIAEALRKHEFHERQARQILERPTAKAAETARSSNSSLSAGQEMAQVAKKIHEEIQAEDDDGGLSRNKRFLKYDAIGMRGEAHLTHAGVASDHAAAFPAGVKAGVKPLPYNAIGSLQSKSVAEFKPMDVIMSSRKLQGALKMKEALKQLPPPSHSTTLDDIPSFPLQIRSKSQLEEAIRGHASRRFSIKMEREAGFRERMADLRQKYSPDAVNARMAKLNPDLPVAERGSSHGPFEIRSIPTGSYAEPGRPKIKRVSLITAKGVQLPTISKLQSSMRKSSSGLAPDEPSELITNQRTTDYDRRKSIKKFVNTALENAKIDKEREKANEEGQISRSMLPGKFLSRIKETREARNDERFRKMK